MLILAQHHHLAVAIAMIVVGLIGGVVSIVGDARERKANEGNGKGGRR